METSKFLDILALWCFSTFLALAGIVFVMDRNNELSFMHPPDATTLPEIPGTPPLKDQPGYKHTFATMFWVGETAGEDNGNIPNHESYWDEQWLTHFGGVDTPECRTGYHPCGFRPTENPFYVALPYGERESDGTLKKNATQLPWFNSAQTEGVELLKNRWVEVRVNNRACFAQVEDVGPYIEDDFAYVFGSSSKPKNTFGLHAGIDLSPAVVTCLGLNENGEVLWRFVDAPEVPQGPWTEIVTTRGAYFTE